MSASSIIIFSMMSIARNDAAKEKMDAVDVRLTGESLGKVKAYKYLGVDLDEHLSLNTMIDTTHNKPNRKVYLLKKIRPYISRWVANQIYKTCILPILDYADFPVDSGNIYNIDKFNSIQKRCLRIIDNGLSHGATVDELMGQYRHTELVDKRSGHLLSLMYWHAQTESNLNNNRSQINLLNNRKIKFKIKKTSLTKVL